MGYSSQAPKSVTKSAENRRPIIPLVARAGRSHVRRIDRLADEGRESFEKFVDHDQLVRLVPVKYSGSSVAQCTCFVNPHCS